MKTQPYNDIIAQAADSLNQYESRVYGLAINGMSPSNATSGPLGAVCAYVWTGSGYNEIVTTTSAVQLDQWTHIIFTRSPTTGMHIYVNGVEQPVMVTSGSKNPTGDVEKGNLFYLGHDFMGQIDEVQIKNIAEIPSSTGASQTFWLQWWFWAVAAGIAVAISAGAAYVYNKGRK